MRVNGSKISPELQGRIDTALNLIRKGDYQHIVFSGGFTSGKIRSEAEFMLQYARSTGGVGETTVMLEERSLDTLGNAIFTHSILKESGIVPSRVSVVTSCYHSHRSEYIFRSVFPESTRVDSPACFQVNSTNAELENEKLEEARRFFSHAPRDPDFLRSKLLGTASYRNAGIH